MTRHTTTNSGSPKPCPFCGLRAVVNANYNSQDIADKKPIAEWRIIDWSISCIDHEGCIGGSIGYDYVSEKAAIEEWNKRA